MYEFKFFGIKIKKFKKKLKQLGAKKIHKSILYRKYILKDNNLDIEFVGYFDDSTKIIDGFQYNIYQESIREKWLLEDTEIVINTIPYIPSIIEIRTKDKSIINKLKLEINDTSLKELFKEYYNIEIPKILSFKDKIIVTQNNELLDKLYNKYLKKYNRVIK